MFCHVPGLLTALLLERASAHDPFTPSRPSTTYGKEYTKDAQGFTIRRYIANLDVPTNHTIGGRPHWIFKDSFVVDLRAFPELCDSEVVEDTCRLFNGDWGDELQHVDSIDPSSVRGVLSASAEAVADFWSAAGMPALARCVDLCHSAVYWLKQHAHVVPPKSDLGCHQDSISGEHVCDIDLSPAPIHGSWSMGSGDVLEDSLDHSGDALDENSQPILAESVDDDDVKTAADGDGEIDYKVADIAVEIAHMFRIYPEVVAASNIVDDVFDEADKVRGNASALRGSAITGRRLYGGSFENKIRVIEQKAIAYIATAVREFQRRNTGKHMNKWFGPQAYSSEYARQQVHKVLRSINSMLSNVEYVYPGPQCESNTYAYVYPRAYTCAPYSLESKACTKTHGGKFVFYMCQLTMTSPMSVQIETLTHEGSHHATAYTDDVCMDNSNPCKNVAYGRRACEMLAKYNPNKAIHNADNYCYYIQDITDISAHNSPIFGPGGGSGTGGYDSPTGPDAPLVSLFALLAGVLASPCGVCVFGIIFAVLVVVRRQPASRPPPRGGIPTGAPAGSSAPYAASSATAACSQAVQMHAMPQPAVPNASRGAQMQVQVPQGCFGGSKIQVTAPDGRAFVVAVPPGQVPGNVFVVSY